MTKGCVFHYLSVIAWLSLSLLNQGWGVPKHYLAETQDGDNKGTQDDDAYVVGTQDDDNNVVGTQDDDAYVVGIQNNLTRTDQDVFNEAAFRGGKRKNRKPKKKGKKPKKKRKLTETKIINYCKWRQLLICIDLEDLLYKVAHDMKKDDGFPGFADFEGLEWFRKVK